MMPSFGGTHGFGAGGGELWPRFKELKRRVIVLCWAGIVCEKQLLEMGSQNEGFREYPFFRCLREQREAVRK